MLSIFKNTGILNKIYNLCIIKMSGNIGFLNTKMVENTGIYIIQIPRKT